MAGDKFRFLFDDFPPNYRGYCFFYEIELMEDSVDVLDNAEGAATASTQSANAYQACDDSDATGWHSDYAAETAHWWQFDFTSETGIVPTSYSFKARNDSYSDEDTPIAWRLQKWVVDEWITIHQVVEETSWSPNEKRIFDVTSGPRFRFRFDDFPPSYRGYCSFNEIELMVDSVDVLDNNEGAAIGSSVYLISFASYACDDNNGTWWNSDYAAETAHWWQFNFDALDTIVPTSYSFKAKDDDVYVESDTPIGWTLQQYNYSTFEWDDLHFVTGEDVWVSLEKRVFDIELQTGKISSMFLVFPQFTIQ